MNLPQVVILTGARTPFGRMRGGLSSLSAVELGAAAIRAAVDRSGVPGEQVEHAIMGHAIQAGAGQNPGRHAAIRAGLPTRVTGETVNKACLSGLLAISQAARMIRLGEAHVVVAGGQESMSNGPHLARGLRAGKGYGDLTLEDSVRLDGLTDVFDHISMGELTEHDVPKLGLSRRELDEAATLSHQRAAQAWADGVLTDEVVPVEVPGRRGSTTLVSRDEGFRDDVTVGTLGELRPAFSQDGALTAGNSSQMSDGAAAIVVASREFAQAHGLSWLATIGEAGQVAGPDNSLPSQPSGAAAAALGRARWSAADLDLLEVNEAFAAVVLQSIRDLAYPLEQTNIHGGAIALGHPLGASGARLALHAALELSRRGGGRACVTLCGAGGQGEALLLQRE